MVWERQTNSSVRFCVNLVKKWEEGEQKTGLQLAALGTGEKGLQRAERLLEVALLGFVERDLPVDEPPARELGGEKGRKGRRQRGLIKRSVAKGETSFIWFAREIQKRFRKQVSGVEFMM